MAGEKYLWKSLRVGSRGGIDVLGFYRAPRHSVLAGQTIKRFLDNYETEALAHVEHPDAEGYTSAWTEPQVILSHLPGDDDLG